MDHFTYFMLRLRGRREPGSGPGITGIVQQLSTGEKRTFADAGELLALLLEWPGPPESNVPADHGGSKVAEMDEAPQRTHHRRQP